MPPRKRLKHPDLGLHRAASASGGAQARAAWSVSPRWGVKALEARSHRARTHPQRRQLALRQRTRPEGSVRRALGGREGEGAPESARRRALPLHGALLQPRRRRRRAGVGEEQPDVAQERRVKARAAQELRPVHAAPLILHLSPSPPLFTAAWRAEADQRTCEGNVRVVSSPRRARGSLSNSRFSQFSEQNNSSRPERRLKELGIPVYSHD